MKIIIITFVSYKARSQSDLSYRYDANGNMIGDSSKGIASIHYNDHNLPDTILFEDGRKIIYSYTATGRKLVQQVFKADGTLQLKRDYLGGFIYQNDTLREITHSEGRILRQPVEGVRVGLNSLGAAGGEYQYHLTDHLGNTRLTFTTDPGSMEYLATMESENAVVENQLFENLDSRVPFETANHTPEGNEVARLKDAMEGPSITLSVYPGDSVQAEVWAYHEAMELNNPINMAWSLANLIVSTQESGLSKGERGKKLQALMDKTKGGKEVALLAVDESDEEILPAYLNYLLMDPNGGFSAGGFSQVSVSGTQEHLELPELVMKKRAYLKVYVNKTETPALAHFDDLKVTHKTSPVTQEQAYYPFGMRMNTHYSRSGELPNRNLYNGKELQIETEWYDYGARQYDPQLGRFFTQDRLAEKYWHFSPYQYAANNPVLYIDVNGDSINVAPQYRAQLNSSLAEVFGDNAKGFSYTKSGNLIYNGTTKGLSENQKSILDGLNIVIGQTTTTRLVFGKSTEITAKNGNKGTLEADIANGAVTVLADENNVLENTILIDPGNPQIKSKLKIFEVTDAYYKPGIIPARGARFIPKNINNSVTASLFHEIGHVLEKGNTQDRVLDFENRVRQQIGLPKRPYDEDHNRTVTRPGDSVILN